jgi:hypothetical protein
MAHVRDLLDDATRARLEAAADDADAAAEGLFAARPHDVVANCPASLLPDLAAAHPELVDEIVRRRGGELRSL